MTTFAFNLTSSIFEIKSYFVLVSKAVLVTAVAADELGDT